jgi:hypothetical protein
MTNKQKTKKETKKKNRQQNRKSEIAGWVVVGGRDNVITQRE